MGVKKAMNNEELGRRVRKLYTKYINLHLERGYEVPSIEDFLEWIENLLEDSIFI